MRSLLSDGAAAGTAREVGVELVLPAWAPVTIAAAATARSALAERRTGLPVEEVQTRNVDGDRDLPGDLQSGARRELGHHIRPRRSHTARMRLGRLLLFVLSLTNGRGA